MNFVAANQRLGCENELGELRGKKLGADSRLDAQAKADVTQVRLEEVRLLLRRHRVVVEDQLVEGRRHFANGELEGLTAAARGQRCFHRYRKVPGSSLVLPSPHDSRVDRPRPKDVFRKLRAIERAIDEALLDHGHDSRGRCVQLIDKHNDFHGRCRGERAGAVGCSNDLGHVRRPDGLRDFLVPARGRGRGGRVQREPIYYPRVFREPC